MLSNKDALPAWLVTILTIVVGTFVRCPVCHQWGANLEFNERRHGWRWRCRTCRHGRRPSHRTPAPLPNTPPAVQDVAASAPEPLDPQTDSWAVPTSTTATTCPRCGKAGVPLETMAESTFIHWCQCESCHYVWTVPSTAAPSRPSTDGSSLL